MKKGIVFLFFSFIQIFLVVIMLFFKIKFILLLKKTKPAHCSG